MTYAIDLERDEAGHWVASARDVMGCHTQGRSLRQALSRMRDALAVCLDRDVAMDELAAHVQLPTEVREAVARYGSASKALDRARDAAAAAADEAIDALVGTYALSVRDAGDLLGLSHQRVHQLTTRSEPRG